MRPGVRALGCAVLAFGAAACASSSRRPPDAVPLPPSPSAGDRLQIRRIAVDALSAPDSAATPDPPSGMLEGAGAGALLGAGWGLQFSAETGGLIVRSGPAGLLLWAGMSAAAFPVFVAGGALYGTFATMSDEELETRLGEVRAAFDRAGPTLGLDTAVADAVHRGGSDAVVADAESADATLHVRVMRHGLLGTGGFDPSVAVVVEIRAVLVVTGGRTAYDAVFDYVGPRRNFTAWTDAPGAMDEELRLAIAHLSDRVGDEALLVTGKAVR